MSEHQQTEDNVQVSSSLKNENMSEERKRKIAENLANGKPWNYGLPHDEKYHAKIEANRKIREEKKRIEKEEKARKRAEEKRIKELERQKEHERLIEENKTRVISEEEWDKPMKVIAKHRRITVEDVNDIFIKQINRKHHYFS